MNIRPVPCACGHQLAASPAPTGRCHLPGSPSPPPPLSPQPASTAGAACQAAQRPGGTASPARRGSRRLPRRHPWPGATGCRSSAQAAKRAAGAPLRRRPPPPSPPPPQQHPRCVRSPPSPSCAPVTAPPRHRTARPCVSGCEWLGGGGSWSGRMTGLEGQSGGRRRAAAEAATQPRAGGRGPCQGRERGGDGRHVGETFLVPSWPGGRPEWKWAASLDGKRHAQHGGRGGGGGVAACPARRPRQFSHFESGSRAGVGWAARHASWARRGHACHGAEICSRVGCDPPTSQRSAGDQWPLRSCGLG